MDSRTFPLPDGRTLVIEECQPSDASDLLAYINEVAGETDNLTFGAGEFGVSAREEEAILRTARDTGNAIHMKGVVDGRVVSLVSLLGSARPRLLHAAELGVSVRAEFHRMGIGRRMCEALIERGRGAGLRKIRLQVREDNLHAIRLYERLGFVREGFDDRGFAFGDRFVGLVSMGLSLDPSSAAKPADTGNIAEALMHEGYNCAQSVLVPHGPALGLDRTTCLRLAAPFGGGMGRAGETCGALTGALMVLGLAHGVPSPLSEDKDRGYAPARLFIERFRQAHGSLLCRDLAGVDLSTSDGLQAFRDRGLHDNLCPRYVRTACRLLGDLLPRPVQE